jgi:hypothetical protein
MEEVEGPEALTPVSCSIADTVGEFVREVWNSRFGFPIRPKSPIFRPNGLRREFANSIRCYSRPEWHRDAVIATALREILAKIEAEQGDDQVAA